MRKSLILACAITAIIVGLESLAVEKVEWRPSKKERAQAIAPVAKHWEPPEWMPWALTSGGIVTILFSTKKK